MSKSKQEFNLERIIELIDKVTKQDPTINAQSYHDLEWVKYYAKELTTRCDGCKDTPHGY